jgi:hypothetical protein
MVTCQLNGGTGFCRIYLHQPPVDLATALAATDERDEAAATQIGQELPPTGGSVRARQWRESNSADSFTKLLGLPAASR